MTIDGLVVIACVVFGAAGFGTRALVMRTSGEARRAYERGRGEVERELNTAREAHKHLVEAAFLRGKEAAAADITIEITPYEEVNEGFWRSSRRLAKESSSSSAAFRSGSQGWSSSLTARSRRRNR